MVARQISEQVNLDCCHYWQVWSYLLMQLMSHDRLVLKFQATHTEPCNSLLAATLSQTFDFSCRYLTETLFLDFVMHMS